MLTRNTISALLAVFSLLVLMGTPVAAAQNSPVPTHRDTCNKKPACGNVIFCCGSHEKEEQPIFVEKGPELCTFEIVIAKVYADFEEGFFSLKEKYLEMNVVGWANAISAISPGPNSSFNIRNKTWVHPGRVITRLNVERGKKRYVRTRADVTEVDIQWGGKDEYGTGDGDILVLECGQPPQKTEIKVPVKKKKNGNQVGTVTVVIEANQVTP